MDWMTNTHVWLGKLLENPEQLQIVFSALIGAAAFIVVLAFYFLIGGIWNPLRKRVKELDGTPAPNIRKIPAKKNPFEMLGERFAPQETSKLHRTEALLRQANFRSESATKIFYGIKFTATMLAPLLLFVVLRLTNSQMSIGDVLYYMLAAGALSFLAPDLLLPRLARRRQERLRRGLPDAMDLLVVCSEAGLGLNACIQRVATEVVITHPELADELHLFSMQSRAGMDNRSALMDLAQRTGLDDIQSLVTMLLQSMRFGTSIADTLRVYSEELRDKRLQHAQEKAARVSTLMIFPLILCIMPSFLIVIIGPAILGVMKALSG